MADEKTVDSWMEELDPFQREIAQTLRGIILQAVPDISESIKWGTPNYAKSGHVCYLAANKGHINLGFFNGAGLKKPGWADRGHGREYAPHQGEEAGGYMAGCLRLPGAGGRAAQHRKVTAE